MFFFNCTLISGTCMSPDFFRWCDCHVPRLAEFEYVIRLPKKRHSLALKPKQFQLAYLHLIYLRLLHAPQHSRENIRWNRCGRTHSRSLIMIATYHYWGKAIYSSKVEFHLRESSTKIRNELSKICACLRCASYNIVQQALYAQYFVKNPNCSKQWNHWLNHC